MRCSRKLALLASVWFSAAGAWAYDGATIIVSGSAKEAQAASRGAPAAAQKEASPAMMLEGQGGGPTSSHQYQFGPLGVTISTGPQTGPAAAFGGVNMKISDYWLGVECQPVAPVLRAQLKLAADEGLAVVAVADDSPAAKAGLREHDVLLKAGAKSLTAVPDLMAAVDATKEQKLSLELLRAGERKKIEVQPAKRPVKVLSDGAVDWGLPHNDADMNTIRQWMQQMAAGQAGIEPGRGPWQFHIMRPGAILPSGSAAAKLPTDTSVTITRRGDDPAKIVVEKGTQRWETTAQELDKLPADIRAAVEPMLASGGAAAAIGFHRHEARRPAKEPTAAEKSPAQGALEKKFDDLNRKMEEMQKALEQLRSGKPPAQSPDRPGGARI